jgi:hypothetical protein
LGDFFGGIFAGGALLIAAIAYKRQVDDKRRQQASKVVMREGRNEDGELMVELYKAVTNLYMQCGTKPMLSIWMWKGIMKNSLEGSRN